MPNPPIPSPTDAPGPEKDASRALSDAADLVTMAVREDVGPGDVTSEATLPADLQAEARVVARSDGVLAGLWIVPMVYDILGTSVSVEGHAEDGDRFEAGRHLATLRGPAAEILRGERAMLNFLQRLCGVATLTRTYVDAVAHTGARIVDTRKTTPGWRRLEKYAVRCGGATNHRMGLWDMVLIKDNHVALAGRSPAELVAAAREHTGGQVEIMVEVDTLEQLAEVLPTDADYVLLDNMAPGQLREAVRMRDQARPSRRPLLEASGNVTLETVRSVAETGVDRISVGALTHSAPALDLACDVVGGPGQGDSASREAGT